MVVVGHSMGGVILIDMLQDPQGAGLPADLRVEALFTVGSQPGLFRSVGALGGATGPGGHTPKPACVNAWSNVFDPIDPLAFRAAQISSRVQALALAWLPGLVHAHPHHIQSLTLY